MITVTAVEFQRHFGRYQDVTLSEPIAITRNGRERIVMLSVDEYHRLKNATARSWRWKISRNPILKPSMPPNRQRRPPPMTTNRSDNPCHSPNLFLAW